MKCVCDEFTLKEIEKRRATVREKNKKNQCYNNADNDDYDTWIPCLLEVIYVHEKNEKKEIEKKKKENWKKWTVFRM